VNNKVEHEVPVPLPVPAKKRKSPKAMTMTILQEISGEDLLGSTREFDNPVFELVDSGLTPPVDLEKFMLKHKEPGTYTVIIGREYTSDVTVEPVKKVTTK